MRGRLIYPYRVTVARVDPVAIEAAGPGGADGFDDVWRTPILETTGDTSGPVRRELDPITFEVQVEPGVFADLRRLMAGFAPEGEMVMTAFMSDFEDAGLIEADGNVSLRPGDRVVDFADRDGTTVLSIADPPGLYIDNANPESWGFTGAHKANLVIIRLTDRPQAGLSVAP